ncbi:hypothetical protein Tco_1329377 [Tanacetum coccineum]
MERKIDEWEKSQNVFSKQTHRTNPHPPLQAQTKHVNVVFTGSGKSDDSLKTQKDPRPHIIVDNKTEKDKPIKTSKRGYHVHSLLVLRSPMYPKSKKNVLDEEEVLCQPYLENTHHRPIPARRLTWRRVSNHLSDRHSSPTCGAFLVYSSVSFFYPAYQPPDTTDPDSSTPQRFVHRSLASTPRRSEAFRLWKSAPLSTPYPPTTSESSLDSSSERSLDSSSLSFMPSHKRCRFPTALVPSHTHVSRSIAPTLADLLPLRKRFRDSYSLEDSRVEHMEVDTADVEAVVDVGISEGVVAHPEDGVDLVVLLYHWLIGDSSESSRGGIPNLEDTIFDLVHYMSEVYIDRITKIETTQRQLETSYLRWHMALSQEEFRQVRRDRDDTRRRLRRLESYVERHLGFRP